MRRICSYCNKEMEPTKDKLLDKISHGICDECLEIEMKKIDKIKTEFICKYCKQKYYSIYGKFCSNCARFQ